VSSTERRLDGARQVAEAAAWPAPERGNVFELPAHDSEAARDLTPADWTRLERNAAEIFEALGLDLDTPGTRDTPRRFVRALFDATAGYDGDPKLRTVFPTERPEGVEGRHAQIVEGPVGFYALCEHHALPFHGRAYIGYVAGDERERASVPHVDLPPAIIDMPTLVDVVAGRHGGRSSDAQTSFFLNVGAIGAQFEGVAAAVYHNARERGLGREIPTEWFLQDVRD